MKQLHLNMDQGMTWVKSFRIKYDLTTTSPVMKIFQIGNESFTAYSPVVTVTDAANGNFDITIPYAKTMEFDQDTLSYQMWIDVSGERVLLYEGNIKINRAMR